jgi:hypothetical protein
LFDKKDGGWWHPLPEPYVLPLPKILINTAAVVAFSGLMGLGYYEHEQVFASSKAPTAALTVASNYKGQIRFISPNDARIGDISTWMAIGGGGTFTSLALVAYWLDHKRRLRQKS